jgi:cephalosporin-C deacetylase
VALFDLALHDLENYRPALAEPSDLDDFWSWTLAETRAYDLDLELAETDNHLALVATYDLSFRGFGGQRINAWLHVPAGASEPLPTVVEYVGYSGGRGLAHQHVAWALAGYAHITIDNRGQGWGGRTGDTDDLAPEAGLIAGPGHLTRGILDPATYYYRRVYADAVRAVDAARAIPLVDSRNIVVAGVSQGGGIAIAVASLTDSLAGALVDVPFLCHFERAVTITDADPYKEIGRYLARNRDDVGAATATLSYFDGAVLASRASVPTLFSVGLMDQVCPPSTVYAAFNRWNSSDKDIVVYPFNGHEGGDEHHQVLKYEWLARRFG